GFESGTAINNDNAIRSTAVANQGSTVVAGTVPNGYTSTVHGSTLSDTDGTILSAQGSVVASSVQENSGGLNALNTASRIGLDLSSETNNVVDSSPSLDRNAITASATANTATTGIGIEPRES